MIFCRICSCVLSNIDATALVLLKPESVTEFCRHSQMHKSPQWILNNTSSSQRCQGYACAWCFSALYLCVALHAFCFDPAFTERCFLNRRYVHNTAPDVLNKVLVRCKSCFAKSCYSICMRSLMACIVAAGMQAS